MIIILLIVFGGYYFAGRWTPKAPSAGLKIACGSDLAGEVIAYTAARLGDMVKVQDQSVTFLKIGDCCGTQAEFALAAGEFDLAVLCPDAAAKFLAAQPGFVRVGGVVQNSDVLVQTGEAPLRRIGYMNGRAAQIKLLETRFGRDVELKPIMAVALPYALERGVVDAVVMDIAQALEFKSTQLTELPSVEPSAVLVASAGVLETDSYRAFIREFNKTAGSLNGDSLEAFLEQTLKMDESEEMIKRWKQMKIRITALPNP